MEYNRRASQEPHEQYKKSEIFYEYETHNSYTEKVERKSFNFQIGNILEFIYKISVVVILLKILKQLCENGGVVLSYSDLLQDFFSIILAVIGVQLLVIIVCVIGFWLAFGWIWKNMNKPFRDMQK